MVSVIVPVCKVEKYLDRCIRSILSQTYTELEIILVDDGSPDRSGVICDQWAERDNRIKVIHQENAGQSGARNAGLEICSGEYVCFVDSDDEIDPQMIEIMFKALQQGSSDLAICGYLRFKENEQLSPFQVKDIVINTLDTTEIWQEVFGRLNNAVWNKLYKRALIGKIRFPTGLIHGEDLFFNLEYITKCASAVKIDAPLYHYYIRPGSITYSAFRDSKFDEITSKDIALKFVRKYQPSQMNNARKFCFRARMNVLRSLYGSGLEKEYPKQVQEYRDYTKKHYSEVFESIRLKERAEYNLFQSLEPVYAWITRRWSKVRIINAGRKSYGR